MNSFVQCDILLCVSTNEVVILQAGNSEHWLLVELGVVKPVHRWIPPGPERSEEHTSELQSQFHLVCRLLLEKKKKTQITPKQTYQHTSNDTEYDTQYYN